jgi:ribosomal protein S18 acetylase RimI-like enzyme
MARAQADGARQVHLEVRDGNPAIAMYRTAGFKPVGRRRKYYHGEDGRDFDALTFAKAIKFFAVAANYCVANRPPLVLSRRPAARLRRAIARF